jgi:hypothetical protein
MISNVNDGGSDVLIWDRPSFLDEGGEMALAFGSIELILLRLKHSSAKLHASGFVI